MTTLKPGTRLRSAVCTTEVMVVATAKADIVLSCGGHPMFDPGKERAPQATLDAAQAGGTALGKRYADAGSGLEVLCTKSGQGTLTVDGVRLEVKAPKALPTSD